MKKYFKRDKKEKDSIQIAKERLYDKVPLTVKQLDIIIVVLVVAVLTVLAVGYLKGNGII
ncbi:MAG: hypothetical protein RR998_09270 [Oscillospiraceae bacterium]